VDAGLVMESTGEIDDAGAVPHPLAAEDDARVGTRKPRLVFSELGRFGPTATRFDGSAAMTAMSSGADTETRGRAPLPRLWAAPSRDTPTPAPH